MTKTVNYTGDQVSKMVEAYQKADTTESRKAVVASLAKELGKTVKSVIAKLSREGAYIKAERVTKSGAAITKKEDVVRDIACKLDLDFDAVKTLGKATKSALELTLEALA